MGIHNKYVFLWQIFNKRPVGQYSFAANSNCDKELNQDMTILFNHSEVKNKWIENKKNVWNTTYIYLQ